jgi:mevalonate kinase
MTHYFSGLDLWGMEYLLKFSFFLMEKKTIYAHGKLLLTAEYFILDGAVGLALPTKLGQSLSIQTREISQGEHEEGHWQSYDADGSMWFEAKFGLNNYELRETNDRGTAERLVQILQAARALKNPPPPQYKPMHITTELTFPRAWGLGTSSTLIYNIATIFNINPFDLLKKTFGGSGYDIACAGATKPILYHRISDTPHWQEVDFNPPFKEQLYFIYLGKKQNSREGITHYREKMKKNSPSRNNQDFVPPQYFDEITALTNSFLTENNFNNFEKLIIEHEEKVADIIQLKRAKSLIFNDFWGEIKSLGAWGGDFILATSDRTEAETRTYFAAKGFDTFLTYKDLIL